MRGDYQLPTVTLIHHMQLPMCRCSACSTDTVATSQPVCKSHLFQPLRADHTSDSDSQSQHPKHPQRWARAVELPKKICHAPFLRMLQAVQFCAPGPAM